MIAFGCSISEPEPYLYYAEPGIRLAAEPDSKIFPFAAVGSIGRSYNLLLDHAGALEDLEAFVLVHPHAQIDDPQLCDKVRRALVDPDVGVIGCVGANNVRTIAWWDGAVVSGPVRQRYQEEGGGELPAYAWASGAPPPAEVEMVDGWLLVLSPWVVRNVRFDESLSLGHGFDLDFCLEVRRAGRKVTVQDLRVIRHHDIEPIADFALWVEAYIRLADKWEGRMPGIEAVDEVDWRKRARRAEAEREAARAMANSKKYGYEARLRPLEDEIASIKGSTSWRVTEPLRRANLWRRDRADRRQGAARG